MSKRKAVYNNQVEVETGTKKNPRTLSKKRREMNIEETNQLLLEKEVIVEDDLGAAKTVLDPFQFCTKLDICNWLLKNPDILRLANEMNESSYVVSSKNTEDKIRLWDESVKCLFLRARNPSSEALDDL
ncbi:256_t:CDS:2, partial [Rhizophagus irregularis]